MNIILVEDEFFAIHNFELTCHEIDASIYLKCFMNPYEALTFIETEAIDIAFLDVEMPGMTGIDLAERIHKIDKQIRIVFVTGFEKYALEAFGVDAVGYLLKPYSKEDVEKEIEKAKTLSAPRKKEDEKIEVRTFGRFDVFINGKPLVFSSKKSKEFLALLVDRRGSTITLDEMVYILWEYGSDQKSKTNMRSVTHRLNKTLEQAHIEDLYRKDRGIYWINTNKINCDYYNFLKEDEKAINAFQGEYMSDYGWAEITLAYLEREKKKKEKG